MSRIIRRAHLVLVAAFGERLDHSTPPEPDPGDDRWAEVEAMIDDL